MKRNIPVQTGLGDIFSSPRNRSARRAGTVCVLLFTLLAWSAPAFAAASLRGSQRSMNRQNRVAKDHDFSFLKSSSQVKKFVNLGLLVRLPGNRHYSVQGASFPYARPEVKLFVERLSRQYYSATGEKLVVTSLTRPLSRQPRNASRISVHPTGMAIDIRRSTSRRARRWLEDALLTMERRGVVEATLERRPYHYHVAVFPKQYAAYVEKKLAEKNLAAATPKPKISPAVERSLSASGRSPSPYLTYHVRRGDTLWTIARKHATSVSRLKQINAIRSPRIYPGQKLMVPTR